MRIVLYPWPQLVVGEIYWKFPEIPFIYTSLSPFPITWIFLEQHAILHFQALHRFQILASYSVHEYRVVHLNFEQLNNIDTRNNIYIVNLHLFNWYVLQQQILGIFFPNDYYAYCLLSFDCVGRLDKQQIYLTTVDCTSEKKNINLAIFSSP